MCYVDPGKTFQWDSLLDCPPPKVTPPFSLWWTDSLKWFISSLCGSDPQQRRPMRQCCITCFSSMVSPGMWFLTGVHSSWQFLQHSAHFYRQPFLQTPPSEQQPDGARDQSALLSVREPQHMEEATGHLLIPRHVGPFTHFQSCQSCGCQTHQSPESLRQPTKKLTLILASKAL